MTEDDERTLLIGLVLGVFVGIAFTLTILLPLLTWRPHQ